MVLYDSELKSALEKRGVLQLKHFSGEDSELADEIVLWDTKSRNRKDERRKTDFNMRLITTCSLPKIVIKIPKTQ